MATIQGVYVALFGRPADPAGLAYFNGITNNGANLAGIASLAGTAEFQTRFAGQSNTQIVNAIYQSLFNRAPEAAGLNFFVDALNKGTLNVNNIAINILDGAQGDDKATITNKLTAADNFTKALDTPTEIGAYQGSAAAAQGRAFLTPVTNQSTSIPTAAATDAAVLSVVTTTPGSTGTAGVTINNVAAGAIVGPNNADPATKTTAGDDTINATGISAASKIDAGAGNDTLNITLTGTTGTGLLANVTAEVGGKPTLAGVEKVFVAFTGGTGADGQGNGTAAATGGNFNLDVSGSTGIKELWNNNSKAGTAGANGAGGTVGAGGDTVTFSNIAVGTTVGVKGDTTAKTVFGFTGAGGTSDTATLALEGATGAVVTSKAVTINDIENLNISVNGTSSVNVADSTLNKVVVTGTGNLSFQSSATSTKMFDASALSGTATIDVSAAVNGVTVTGTKGIDTISLNTKVAALATDKDVVVYTAANVSTLAATDVINDFTAGEDKIDLKAFGLTGATFTKLNDGAVPSLGATISIAVAQSGTATMVYIDSNKAGGFDGNDLVLNLANTTAADLKITDFLL